MRALALAFWIALPALAAAQAPADPYALRPTTTDEIATEAPAVDPVTTAAVPSRRAAPQTDPYEALGIRAGGYVMLPSLTLTAGHTSNAAGAAGGTAASYGVVEPAVTIRSDWARHEAELTLRGSYRHYFDGTAADRPEAAIAARGRLDVGSDWAVKAVGSYRYDTQNLSDPDFPAGVDSPPGVHNLAASLGAERSGPLAFAAEIKVDRTVYENGTSGGLPIDQGDRTNSDFGGRLRLGYAVAPSLTPYVEGVVARRLYDRTLDTNGIMRSAWLATLRAGIAFDRGPILTGALALGYGVADFDDPALATLRGVVVDGDLAWSPSRLLTIKLHATTGFNGSTDPLSSGSLARAADVDVAYAWRRNVTVDATAGVRRETFDGSGTVDTGYTAGLAATWKANRTLWLTAGYEHQWLTSTDAAREYQSDAVRVALRAQR